MYGFDRLKSDRIGREIARKGWLAELDELGELEESHRNAAIDAAFLKAGGSWPAY